MEKLLGFFVAMCVMVACTTPNIQKETLVVVPDSEEEDGTIVEDSDSGTDSSGESSVKRHAAAEYCSVEVIFYFEGNTATSIALVNHNDVAVIVNIDNQTTGGVTLQNCLWPENHVFGGEDEEITEFASSDSLELEIYLGQGVSASVCSETIGDLLNSFELCEDITHEISFVFK